MKSQEFLKAESLVAEVNKPNYLVGVFHSRNIPYVIDEYFFSDDTVGVEDISTPLEPKHVYVDRGDGSKFEVPKPVSWDTDGVSSRVDSVYIADESGRILVFDDCITEFSLAHYDTVNVEDIKFEVK